MVQALPEYADAVLTLPQGPAPGLTLLADKALFIVYCRNRYFTKIYSISILPARCCTSAVVHSLVMDESTTRNILM